MTLDQDGMRKNFDICLEWAGLQQVRSVDMMMMMMIPAESCRRHPLFKAFYICKSLIVHQSHYIVTVLIPILQLRNSTLLNVCVYRNFRNINIKKTHLRIKGVWCLARGLVVSLFGCSAGQVLPYELGLGN